MGCDCHIYTEKWTNVTNNNCPRLKSKSQIRDEKISTLLDIDTPVVYRWESCDDWYFEEGTWERFEIWSERNYDLFSFLADVRNDGSIDPLDEPRGIPKDASESYLWACRAWDGGAHSHSWFLLEELLRYDIDFWINLHAESFYDSLLQIDRDGDGSEVRVCFFFDS
jgi:hypothetical protein